MSRLHDGLEGDERAGPSAGRSASSARRRTIGILGGFGPHAHIEFERCLLAACEPVSKLTDYPAWVLYSAPRTLSDSGDGEAALDAMLDGLAHLAHTADFAVVPCNTAHLAFEQLEARGPLPLVSMIAATVAAIAEQIGPAPTVGLVGATPMLRGRLYPRAARLIAPAMNWLDPLDLDGGAGLQQRRVMCALEGVPDAHGNRTGGLISGVLSDPVTGRPHAEALGDVVDRLIDAGAQCVVLGCTELSIALGRSPIRGRPLIDPLVILADHAVDIACGRLPLPVWRGDRPEPTEGETS